MEPLDQELAEAFVDQTPSQGPARILLASADESRRAALRSLLSSCGHRCTCASRADESLAAASRSPFDLVIIDPELLDGDGITLAEQLQKSFPATRTIIVSGGGTLDLAVRALRVGVADFIAMPIDPDDFARRVDRALLQARADQQREERVARLKRICQKLNVARHEISDQVDSLCNDLVCAYREVAEQLNEVAMSSEFRTLLRQELDVEDLLRTSLQYTLTKTGPTNAAVFLPSGGDDYALGAYVNYDCPRETASVLLDHLCTAVCPQMADETEIVSFDDTDEFAEWIGMDADFLGDCQVVSFACRHKGECMAVVILFRKKSDGFTDETATIIDVLRPIFAEQLHNIIRIHHRARPQWPAEARDSDDEDTLDADDDYGLAA